MFYHLGLLFSFIVAFYGASMEKEIRLHLFSLQLFANPSMKIWFHPFNIFISISSDLATFGFF